jgi:dsDNA-specific endonuclease/ATPase MutS2
MTIMAFKVGDKVGFLHEKGEGRVISIISAFKVRVELTEGLEIEVKMSELVAIKPIPLTNMPSSPKEPFPSSQPKPQSKGKPHSSDEIVIDLHAEKLDEHSYAMNNAQKLTLQLDHFQRALERALRGHAKKIVFIHGVGNGVLKQSIRYILNRYEGIEFSDASYQKYGHGATEVRIISRNKFRASF